MRRDDDRQAAAPQAQKRVAQLQEQIKGSESRIAAYRAQLRSVLDEKESLAELISKQLILRSKVLQLDRTASGLEGQPH